QRENKELLWGSMVKETMKRKRPSFNESYYGFRTFSHLLEDAQRRGIVTLRRDQKSGSYIIEDLGPAAAVAEAGGERKVEVVGSTAAPAPAPGQAAGEAGEANGARSGRRRRGRGGRGRRTGVPSAPGALPEAGGQTVDDGDDDDDDSDEIAAAAANGASASQAGEPERPAFSLFSWLRREPEEKKEP
ncbi:MAG TPA: OST-HTH/LOTUS domain-containing protein, partial [Vicinamibacteria bacterium]